MKKSIRIAVATIILVSVLSLCACGNNKVKPETKSLYAQGLEVVQLMAEMTQTQEYIDIAAPDNLKSIIQELADGDYSTPKAVYSIKASEKDLATIAEIKNFDNISDNLKPLILSKICGSFIARVNGMGGVEDVAVAGLCTAGKTFVNEDATGNIIYLYTYDNAVPVAVTFVTGDDNSVSANGTFVMYDEFTCDSADEIKDFFDYITVEVTEVNPEK